MTTLNKKKSVEYAKKIKIALDNFYRIGDEINHINYFLHMNYKSSAVPANNTINFVSIVELSEKIERRTNLIKKIIFLNVRLKKLEAKCTSH